MRLRMRVLGIASAVAGAGCRPAAAGDTAAEGEIVISVPGIPGPYCAYGVEKRLYELPGVAMVKLRWSEERIEVIPAAGGTLTETQVRGAVERAEYPYHYSVAR